MSEPFLPLIDGFMPLQFLLEVATVLFLLGGLAYFIQRAGWEVRLFTKAVVVFSVIFVWLKYRIYPPVPLSIIITYLTVAFAAIMLWVSSSEAYWQEFRQPIIALLDAKTVSMKFFRSIVLILIPFLAGLSAWNTLSAIKDEPIELRTVHPAIPDKVTVHGKSIILDKGQNPFRVDDTGSYSSTINRKYAAGVPFGESLPLYLAAVQQGGAVYFQECVFCHGANLSSRGIFANAFNPVPISFTSLFKVLRPWYSDVFIRTAKGGLWLPLEGFPWASTMPPMEEHISTEDIWKVTLFIYWHTGTEPYWDD